MCVICIKPAGVKMPDEQIIRAMAMTNPHGFGFAASNGMNCKTMNFDLFMSKLSKVPASASCVMHFRLATHGSINPRNCHPFFDKDTNVWFAHNGVLPIDSTHDMTDSEIYFRNDLVPAIKAYGLASPKFDKVADRLRGHSKFAYLHGKDVYIQGEYSEYHGCLYSNMHWHYRLRAAF